MGDVVLLIAAGEQMRPRSCREDSHVITTVGLPGDWHVGWVGKVYAVCKGKRYGLNKYGGNSDVVVARTKLTILHFALRHCYLCYAILIRIA